MISHTIENGVLTVFPKGEMDHHSVVSVRAETDELLKKYRPEKTVLDFDNVTFCDSSGIAYVMGRYRIMQTSGGNLALVNVPPKVMTIFTMAGMDKMMTINPRGEQV